MGYYFGPIRYLIDNYESSAFAAGALCFLAIDAIAEMSIKKGSKERSNEWMLNLPDFKDLDLKDRNRVYVEFRCGLVHEARIKNGGQFTYSISKAIEIRDGTILINPKQLLEQIEDAFDDYTNELSKDEKKLEEFRNNIIDIFEKDLRLVK